MDTRSSEKPRYATYMCNPAVPIKYGIGHFYSLTSAANYSHDKDDEDDQEDKKVSSSSASV